MPAPEGESESETEFRKGSESGKESDRNLQQAEKRLPEYPSEASYKSGEKPPETFQAELLPPSQGSFHLFRYDGLLRLLMDDYRIVDGNLDRDIDGLGFCLQGMIEKAVGHGSIGLGPIVLKMG